MAARPIRPVVARWVEGLLAELGPAAAGGGAVRVAGAGNGRTRSRPCGRWPNSNGTPGCGGEVRLLRGGDLDTAGPVWRYRPPGHKMAYAGRDRVVLLGPRARSALSPFLVDDPTALVFIPGEGSPPPPKPPGLLRRLPVRGSGVHDGSGRGGRERLARSRSRAV